MGCFVFQIGNESNSTSSPFCYNIMQVCNLLSMEFDFLEISACNNSFQMHKTTAPENKENGREQRVKVSNKFSWKTINYHEISLSLAWSSRQWKWLTAIPHNHWWNIVQAEGGHASPPSLPTQDFKIPLTHQLWDNCLFHKFYSYKTLIQHINWDVYNLKTTKFLAY